MTTYKTGNPIGSTAVKDLYDNAENLDTAVNDTSRYIWSDRFGRSRKTMSGMERDFNADQADRDARFNAFIASSGYQFLGDYAAGINITEYNQLVRDSSGEFWRVSGQVDLPYVTTGAGIPEGDALVPVGDAVLRQELEAPLGSLGEILSQGGLKSKGGLSFPIEKRRPVAAFIDDDGHSLVWTKLKPFMDSRGIKPGIAIYTDAPGQSSRLTWEQIKTLRDEGWEVLSHTKTNKNLSGLTEEEIAWELRESRRDFERQGIQVESFVPVQGASGGEAGYRQMQNYYRAAFFSTGSVQPDQFRNYRVLRINAFATTESSNPTLGDLKAYIDQSVSENKAMVFASHIFYPGATEAQMQVVSDAIDYARSLGVEFVTPSKLLDIHGNKIEFGNTSYLGGLTPQPRFALSSEGDVWPAGSRYETAGYRGRPTRNGQSVLTEFEENQTTTMRTGSLEGLPNVGTGVGILETLHLFQNNTERYGAQRYYPRNSNRGFFRVWDEPMQSWGEWLDMALDTQPNLIFQSNSSLDGNSPITDYANHKKHIMRTFAGQPGWPAGGVYVVETYRYSVDGNDYGKQIAWSRLTGTESKRYWLHNATEWTDWELVT